MVTYQDRIWGVPANSPAGGLFWRYDVVTEYGIDPTAIETWDDFVAAAQTIESESGGEVAMLQMPSVGLPYEVYATIQQEHRAELIGSDLTVKIGPDSAEWLATLEDWRAVRDGITGVEMEQWTQPWYQTIKDGSIAVFPSGTWFVEVIKQQAPDSVGAWYFTPFPAVEEGGDRYPNFGSATCFISSATDDPVAGMEWVKVWTMEPASTLEIGLNQLGISVISKAALESPIVNAPHEYFAEDQAYWFDATEAFALSTYVPPVTKYDAEAGDIFNRYTEQWWLGNITDQEFLQSVADELAALVAE
ncbi:MAG: extracellular solute-binding protein [Anaerolineae bacterium]|nr:extracellular solute-binding protein [Anaerolineae bacterium]